MHPCRPFDYGIAFHRRAPEEMYQAFSQAVLGMQAANQLGSLSAKYLGQGDGPDACSAQPSEEETALQFVQVSGLYVILGSVAAAGLLSCFWAIW